MKEKMRKTEEKRNCQHENAGCILFTRIATQFFLNPKIAKPITKNDSKVVIDNASSVMLRILGFPPINDSCPDMVS